MVEASVSEVSFTNIPPTVALARTVVVQANSDPVLSAVPALSNNHIWVMPGSATVPVFALSDE